VRVRTASSRILLAIVLVVVVAGCDSPEEDGPRTVLKADRSTYAQLVVSGEWLYFRSEGDDSESNANLGRHGPSGKEEYPPVPVIGCQPDGVPEGDEGVVGIFPLAEPELGVAVSCGGEPHEPTMVLANNRATSEWREIGPILDAAPPAAGDGILDANACWTLRSRPLINWWEHGGSRCTVPGGGELPVNGSNGDLFYVGTCGSPGSVICRRAKGSAQAQALPAQFSAVTGLATVGDDLLVAGVFEGQTGLYRLPISDGTGRPTRMAVGTFSNPVVSTDRKTVYFLDCAAAKRGCRRILSVDL
jgi:hypothetical protein